MIANLGFGALVISFLVSVYGAGAAVYGARKNAPTFVDSARGAMLLTFPLLTISAFSIIYLLATQHYEIAYVSSVTSNSMPLYLKITALWGGQAGSLILWSWLMSAFASAATLRNWDRDREFLPWVIVVSLVTLAFFVGMSIALENPFARLWQTFSGEVITRFLQPAGAIAFIPRDGNGLNPLLRHPGMVAHPPLLYLGFVSFVIPYAFAMAALITGRTDDRWIRLTRRWTVIAWLFLSLGLILGMWWAYDVLGWGGYWGWDPVEIAALMPWLTGTAFLHSVMIQEKRGMLKQWNMVLIILTYDLVIFGTFLTRSGVLSSVHAFSQSAIGPVFFAFIGATLIASLSLLLRRWNDLKAEAQLASWFSREALFLINNLLFVGIFVVCLWGVIFPLISELVTGQKMTVGPAFYEPATGPLWVALVFLMGICPLSAWQLSTYRTIGRAAWKPALASLIVPIALLIAGIRQPGALLGFWVIAYAAFLSLYQLFREALARYRAHNDNLLISMWRLIGRNRRRYGGLIIHVSVILMALGVIGIELFQTETQGTIAPGQQLTLGSYRIKFDSLATFDTPDGGLNVARAVVSIYKNNAGNPVPQLIGTVYPRRDYYYESQQPMTIPGVYSSISGDDIYVVLVDWQSITSQGATFKIYSNPLVNWMWLGGLVLLLGSLIAAWPAKDPDATALARRAALSRREA